MINLEEYSDEDYILYQVANWAMLGLVDIVNLDYDFKFYSFLDELFNTNEISGEPGWFIEKIECDKNLDFLNVEFTLICANKFNSQIKEHYEIEVYFIEDSWETERVNIIKR